MMLADIRAETRLTRDYTGIVAIAPPVMEAMGTIPRHRFVPDYLQDDAYVNGPLPIGHGQTISQPFIVALMTHILEVTENAKVLEIGTGCGYQTAVLAELAGAVYSVELVEALASSAAKRLADMGYENVFVRHGDGYEGWPDQAPFDGILVTAAAPHIPRPLLEQLKPNAPLVLPVDRGVGQELVVVRRKPDGSEDTRDILPVAFVPLVRS